MSDFICREDPDMNRGDPTCREDRIRTCDPLVPNQVFYRAELPPEPNKAKLAKNNLTFAKTLANEAVREGFEPSVHL